MSKIPNRADIENSIYHEIIAVFEQQGVVPDEGNRLDVTIHEVIHDISIVANNDAAITDKVKKILERYERTFPRILDDHPQLKSRAAELGDIFNKLSNDALPARAEFIKQTTKIILNEDEIKKKKESICTQVREIFDHHGVKDIRTAEVSRPNHVVIQSIVDSISWVANHAGPITNTDKETLLKYSEVFSSILSRYPQLKSRAAELGDIFNKLSNDALPVRAEFIKHTTETTQHTHKRSAASTSWEPPSKNSRNTDEYQYFKKLLYADDVKEIKNFRRQYPEFDVNTPDQYGWTFLHSAICGCDLTTIKTLLQEYKGSIDVNVKDKYGITPLHLLIDRAKPTSRSPFSTREQYAIIEEFDINIKNPEGDALVHILHKRGYDQLLYELLKNDKFDLNIKDSKGNAVLHELTYTQLGNDKLEKLFQSSRIDANVQDKDGNTPLHLTIIGRSPVDIVSNLLNNDKVNPNIQNHQGKTPLDIALEKKLVRITYALLKNEKIIIDEGLKHKMQEKDYGSEIEEGLKKLSKKIGKDVRDRINQNLKKQGTTSNPSTSGIGSKKTMQR